MLLKWRPFLQAPTSVHEQDRLQCNALWANARGDTEHHRNYIHCRLQHTGIKGCKGPGLGLGLPVYIGSPIWEDFNNFLVFTFHHSSKEGVWRVVVRYTRSAGLYREKSVESSLDVAGKGSRSCGENNHRTMAFCDEDWTFLLQQNWWSPALNTLPLVTTVAPRDAIVKSGNNATFECKGRVTKSGYKPYYSW